MGERNRLFEARKRAGLSLGQVQQYAGISKSQLSELERGIGQPTAGTLLALADLYRTSVDYLLGRTPDPAPPGVSPDGDPRPPWAADLLDLARAMSARGRSVLLALAHTLAEQDRQWLIWDAIAETLTAEEIDGLAEGLTRAAAAGPAAVDELLRRLHAGAPLGPEQPDAPRQRVQQ